MNEVYPNSTDCSIRMFCTYCFVLATDIVDCSIRMFCAYFDCGDRFLLIVLLGCFGIM